MGDSSKLIQTYQKGKKCTFSNFKRFRVYDYSRTHRLVTSIWRKEKEKTRDLGASCTNKVHL